MDTQRLILFFVFTFSLLLLWDAWEKERRSTARVSAPPESGVPAPTAPPAKAPAGAAPATAPPVPGAAPAPTKGEVVTVRTDLYVAEIDTSGATLRRLELLAHKDTVDPAKNFVLFGPEHQYAAQSGLIGEQLPNHRSAWRALPGERELSPGAESFELRLAADGPPGVTVEKIYTFRRNSYLIDVAFEVTNGGAAPLAGHAYFQLVRDGRSPAGESAMMYTFTGPAVYTAEKAFRKIEFSELDKDKADYPRQARDGWIAMVQHYFVAAWLPADQTPREYYARKLPDALYAAGTILALPAVEPGARQRVSATLYAGPQEQRRLKAAAPGLELVVDYGWLAIIAWPLFAVLEFFYEWSGNWGVAIILLTVLIKLIFFPLSAASYKSMAKMKLVTPRLQRIREMYEHDRAKMNQAMMELYRTEKINPLGGCLPILVQIPVFIALYWVLLAAIELRHAPFVLWIKDLSALDPYYVLPVLMTVTMVIQTRMNPPPPDPVQAKVMQFMPYVFSVFFFFFPAGLVLYWLVNNILSILQQWQIQRMFERDKPAHARR
ncbi:MAG: membrane protein insertase YidC [Burkholderiales bacterium]|nr:membrane protein insertase YidC [Burkholderiales bacterium]